MNKMKYEYLRASFSQSLVDVGLIEENIQMIFFSILAFSIPFLLGHPQWVVGIIVNASLILGATYIRGYKMLPLILLPSIGVITAGLIFGTYTIFLLYLVPFIWIANALYVYLYRNLSLRKFNPLIALLYSSTAKSLFLFSVAFVLVSAGILPQLFLTAMGVLQIVTSIAGGIAALVVVESRKKIVAS